MIARFVLVGASTIVSAAIAAGQLPVSRSMSVEAQEESDTLWTIESGTYAGLKIPLHVDAALGGRGGREHFWRLAADGGLSTGLVGWKSTRYPIPLAFRHDRHSRAITLDDSAAFWAILGDMSRDFGLELFRPASVGSEDPPDVIVVDLGTVRNVDGLSRATWTQSGELFDVRVTFHDVSVLHNSHIVTHEMMHALGFGHTTAWQSVVNSYDGSRPLRVTPEDVAYAELAMHSRVRRERVDMRRIIALAVARESSRLKDDEANPFCDFDMETPNVFDEPATLPRFVPSGLLTVVPLCAP